MRRIALFIAAGLCVVLVAYAGMRAGALLVEARTKTLFDAERAIAQATAPLVEQGRIPDRLVVAVESLVARASLGLNYLTLRNANGVTLVSRGRLRDAFDWLPMAQARQWRSWYYRLRSAETNRPLLQDEQRIGYAHFGVGWVHVYARAERALTLWLLAALAGLFGLCWAAIRAGASAPVDPEPRRTAAKPIKRTARIPARTATEVALAPISRLARRVRGEKADFAPIAAAPTARAPPDTADETPTGAQQTGPAANDGPESVRVGHAVPATDRSPASVADARPLASTVAEVVPATGDTLAAPKPLHAPRVTKTPELGDSTLDLRFYPVWADVERRVLSAAVATLAWRTGETEPVDSATLTRLAEKDGALRAFTRWIARRFSLLHGNWRTLELATVPIMLPIPSDMLAFADAEAVWRDALRRTDRDPNDLILRMSRQTAEHDRTALPVRRAINVSRPDAWLDTPCDVLCVHPERLDGHAEGWRELVERQRRPLLLGPVADPAVYADLIGHERVFWYTDSTDSTDSLHSPRAFARMLTRYRIEPI